jgi:hypothetical protein
MSTANQNNVTLRSVISRPLLYEELDTNFQELIYTIVDTNDHIASSTAHDAESITFDNTDTPYSGNNVGDVLRELGVKNNPSATTDPTVNDDETQDYKPFSRWVNTSTGEIWICLDATTGAAVWQKASLTIDELGSAALVNMGTGPNQIRTNSENEALFTDVQETTNIAEDNSIVFAIALG